MENLDSRTDSESIVMGPVSPAGGSPSTKRTSAFLSSVLFLVLGTILGYFIAIYLPVSKAPKQVTPQTTISPTVTSYTSNNKTIKDEHGRFQIKIPANWNQVENMSGNENFTSFEAPDGSSLQINILDSNTTSLSTFLTNQDEIDKTSWEGLPGRKVLYSANSTLFNLPSVERIEEWSAAGFQVISVYTLIGNTVYQFVIIPGPTGDYKESDVFSTYQEILKTFEVLPTVSGFVCPVNGWQNCMPMLNEAGKKACSSEAMAWYKANCPNFQGAAL